MGKQGDTVGIPPGCTGFGAAPDYPAPGPDQVKIPDPRFPVAPSKANREEDGGPPGDSQKSLLPLDEPPDFEEGDQERTQSPELFRSPPAHQPEMRIPRRTSAQQFQARISTIAGAFSGRTSAVNSTLNQISLRPPLVGPWSLEQSQAVYSSSQGCFVARPAPTRDQTYAGDVPLMVTDRKPTFLRCGAFKWTVRWKVEVDAKWFRGHDFIWVIQDLLFREKYLDQCETVVERATRYLEAWPLKLEAVEKPAPGKPAPKRFASSTGSYNYDFGGDVGKKELVLDANDSWDHPGVDPSCGMFEFKGEVYLAYELPLGFEPADKQAAGKRAEKPGLILAGRLPARKRPLAAWEKEDYLVVKEPVLERFATAAWNCCDKKNWVDGVASWRIPNPGGRNPWEGTRWWVDPGDHGDHVETHETDEKNGH